MIRFGSFESWLLISQFEYVLTVFITNLIKCMGKKFLSQYGQIIRGNVQIDIA
jgi:hypothetical protein